mgnify:FL=1
MKKFLATAIALTIGAAACVFTACAGENDDGTYTVYAPDGAPALALANAVNEDDDRYDFHIVASNAITAQVQGEEPAADFCILPVNVAAKLLGKGETYQMLGTVTNGNMYLLTTGGNPEITTDNLSTLVGKTVGVVQLNNVPGLTFQAVLSRNDIDYQILGNDVEAASDKVNLQAFADASTVTPASGCDYYLCPEPAATGKINGTASSANPFKLAGSLQTLYDGENGYPQAVLVAKTSVIEEAKSVVDTFITYMEGSADFLASASAADVVALLEDCYTEGMTPSLNANNLNATVIANCSVYFTAAQDCKSRVNAFLAELIDLNAEFTSAVSDSFYYAG